MVTPLVGCGTGVGVGVIEGLGVAVGAGVGATVGLGVGVTVGIGVDVGAFDSLYRASELARNKKTNAQTNIPDRALT
jgi:hypothetical protein